MKREPQVPFFYVPEIVIVNRCSVRTVENLQQKQLWKTRDVLWINSIF